MLAVPPSRVEAFPVQADEFAFAESGTQGEFVQRVQPVNVGYLEELSGLDCCEGLRAPWPRCYGLDIAGDVAGQFVYADGVFQCRLEHGVHVRHGQGRQPLLTAFADRTALLPFD
ncbi:hypothetical protein ACFCXT_08980 [Streptomyces vinaceus]|uniref:hypothetical protein n=1 Tax=Streptomyces vinaceus TaxID=1960 RepID=UPI0035DC20F3